MIIGPINGFVPRLYQHHAINGGDQRRGPGIMPCFSRYKNVLAVMATGLGKTETFLALARRFLESPKVDPKSRVLLLSHRDELVTQPITRGPRFGLCIGREQGPETCVGSSHRVISSTIQTMRSRKEQYRANEIGLIIVDECHHSPADDYKSVLEYFEGAFVLGVTATPERLDGVGLGEVFEAVAYEYPIEQAVDDGWLVPVRPWPVTIEGLDLSKLRARAGDLEPGALGELMSEYAHPVAKDLVERSGDRPTLVFCATVAHAFAQAEALRRYTDARVECVYGGTAKAPKKRSRQASLLDAPPVREDIIADFKAGKIRYLVNCAVLTEGFDAPNTRCVAIVRPTQSSSLLIQAVGRGTRPLPGIVDLTELRDDPEGRCAAIATSSKPNLLVLDFRGGGAKFTLAGVADALAGKLTPEERLALTKIELVGDKTVDQALQEARILAAEMAAKNAAELAELNSTAYEIDPFHPVCVLGLRGLRDDKREERAGPKTVGFLAQHGVQGADKISVSTARKMQVAIVMRAKLELASFKQSAALTRAGVPAGKCARMKYVTASQLCAELAQNGYRRPPRWNGDPGLGGQSGR